MVFQLSRCASVRIASYFATMYKKPQKLGGVDPDMMPIYLAIIFMVVCLVVGAVAGIALGYNRRKAFAEREIGSAEEEARRIIK